MKSKMVITIADNEFSYDVKALAMTFFPEVECEVIQDENIRSNEGYALQCEQDGQTILCCVVPNPYDKNRVKQTLYQTFSEIADKQLPWGILTGIRPAKIPLRMFMGQLSEAEIRTILRHEYWMAEDKVNLVIDVAKKEYQLLEGIHHDKCYSIYIGIPFCPTRCHYCSFAAYPLMQYQNRVDEYLQCLVKELDYVAKAYPKRRLTTIYIGGGTPTALNEEQLEFLLQEIEKRIDVPKLLEYTVEAGRPDSITEEKLRIMKQYGVTRISINPQTMKQETLERMGRKHTTEQVQQVFQQARNMGFDNINMDLIAGLEGESCRDFQNTLHEIQKMNPDSITAHTLVIKRASRLREERLLEQELLPELDVVPLMQQEARRFARENGYEPYYMYRQKNKSGTTKNNNQENVAYAKPGKECLYNVYIMEEMETILAIGAGASTKIMFPEQNKMERIGNVKTIEEYIKRIDEMIDRKRNMI